MESSWISGLVGGLLIGASATILLAVNGRIAGISGVFNQAIQFKFVGGASAMQNRVWCWLFLIGLLGGGAIYSYILAPHSIPITEFTPGKVLIAGWLVGFGTRLGNGCTSGHGVCGLGRLSWRSLVAVLIFLSTAMMTVFLINHLI
jgi:uncharacterized protein